MFYELMAVVGITYAYCIEEAQVCINDLSGLLNP